MPQRAYQRRTVLAALSGLAGVTAGCVGSEEEPGDRSQSQPEGRVLHDGEWWADELWVHRLEAGQRLEVSLQNLSGLRAAFLVVPPNGEAWSLEARAVEEPATGTYEVRETGNHQLRLQNERNAALTVRVR